MVQVCDKLTVLAYVRARNEKIDMFDLADFLAISCGVMFKMRKHVLGQNLVQLTQRH